MIFSTLIRWPLDPAVQGVERGVYTMCSSYSSTAPIMVRNAAGLRRVYIPVSRLNALSSTEDLPRAWTHEL